MKCFLHLSGLHKNRIHIKAEFIDIEIEKITKLHIEGRIEAKNI